MKKYYQIETSGTKATIYIYGDITDENYSESDVSALSFRNELSAIPLVSEIEVRVQSYGGSVFSGVAIYNMLKNHKAVVTVYIDGVACSIATVIAMAGDKIIMPSNSMMMIHNPMSSLSYGNSNELRKMADTLDKIRESSIDAYLSKSNGKITREKLIELLDEETWLSAEECKNYGFCDEVTNQVELVAKFNESTCINSLKNNPIKLEEKKEVNHMNNNQELSGKKSLTQMKQEVQSAGEVVSQLEDKLTNALMMDSPDTVVVNALSKQLEEKKEQMNDLIQVATNEENLVVDRLENQYSNKEGQTNFVNTDTGKSIQMLTSKANLSKSQNTINADDKADLGKMVKGMITGRWEGATNEQRIVAMNTNGDGNVLIPTTLSAQMIDMVRARSVLNQAGMITVPMDSSTMTVAKQTRDIPTNWKKESELIEIGDPSFTPVKFTAKTLVGLCKVSIEMLEDARNIGSLIGNSLIQSLALNLDSAGIIGTGVDPVPLGLYNTDAIKKVEIGEELKNYKNISQAVTAIMNENGQPNSILMNPRTYGELDNLTDTSGQPLNAPQSYNNLENHLVTTQIPTNLGTGKNGSFAIVGDFSKLWLGLRTNIVLEVSRTSSSVFDTLEYAVRAYLRADFQTVHDPHFIILDDIK